MSEAVKQAKPAVASVPPLPQHILTRGKSTVIFALLSESEVKVITNGTSKVVPIASARNEWRKLRRKGWVRHVPAVRAVK